MNLEREVAERLADVRALTPEEILGQWEDIALEAMRFDALIGATWTLIENFPYDRAKLEALLATGRFHLLAVRWPNKLRGVIAWAGPHLTPPPEAIEAAYARAWQALEHFREDPEVFAAELALFDMEVGGNA